MPCINEIPDCKFQKNRQITFYLKKLRMIHSEFSVFIKNSTQLFPKKYIFIKITVHKNKIAFINLLYLIVNKIVTLNL
jgi:hypothetical protein